MGWALRCIRVIGSRRNGSRYVSASAPLSGALIHRGAAVLAEGVANDGGVGHDGGNECGAQRRCREGGGMGGYLRDGYEKSLNINQL